MMLMNSRSLSFRCWVVMVLVAFAATACPGLGWLGAARADVQQDLEQAETHIMFAEYDKALEILDSLISEGGLSGESLRDAHVLKGRGHALQGQESLAVDSFCRALKSDPTWSPDEFIFTDPEMELFGRATEAGCHLQAPPVEEKDGKPFYMKPVAWVGAAAGVALVLILGGGGDSDPDPDPDPDLADFPDPPGGG